VNCNQPTGFSIYEISTKSEKVYRTLQEIVRAYDYALVYPLNSSISFET
jgi:hypothetical protein